MSIAEFSAAIKSQAFRDFFNRISKESVLKASTKDIRKGEQTATKTSFYINKDTIQLVISKLLKVSTSDVSKETVDSIFSKLKSTAYSSGVGKRPRPPKQFDDNTIYFPRISFDTIGRVLNESFDEVLVEARKENAKINIFSDSDNKDMFNRGHVFGIFPKKVTELSTSLSRNTTLDPKHKKLLLDILNTLEKDLEEQDLDTANIKDPNFKLYASYKKKPGKYLVELQLSSENIDAGNKQAGISSALSKFFNPGSFVPKFGSGKGEQLIKTLIESKGSPSMLDLISESLVEVLTNKPVSNKEYASGSVLVKQAKVKVDKKKLLDSKKDLSKVKKLKQTINNIPGISTNRALDTDLSSLEAILRRKLQPALIKNMGTGSSKNVLNYRSGRFAHSATIDHLTQSKAGMISVFYNYMKYPYATFSEGGRQEYPRSRDPKTLISNTIREIAAQEAVTRLRSVLV